MYAGAYISTQVIGSLKEVSLEFKPSLLGRLLGTKMGTLTYRGNGEMWFAHPSGVRVEPEMVPFLENVWRELGPKPKTLVDASQYQDEDTDPKPWPLNK